MANGTRRTTMEHVSHSVEDTLAIAAQLARGLSGGECIALEGELGAGKTQFVRGLVEGLGGDPRAVSSPTFVLLHMYRAARITVYHLDAYRVAGADDFEQIGFPELLEQGGVVAVEWAERVRNLLPARYIHVHIVAVDAGTRKITISG